MLELFTLPYSLDALEPVLSKEIMELHYLKHHAGYVEKYNDSLLQYQQAEKNKDLVKLLSLYPILEFHGGGHFAHSFFWESLCPKNIFKPLEGKLLKQIEKDFKSLDDMIKIFNSEAMGLMGSGWCYLSYDQSISGLSIDTTKNHLLPNKRKTPLLVIDMWEHAYYLQYQNRKGDYLKAIWEIINWQNVSSRATKVIK